MEQELESDVFVARSKPRRLRRVGAALGRLLATLLVWAFVAVAILSATGRFRLVAVPARGSDVHVATNSVAVVDTQNHRVRVFEPGGNIDAFAGDGANGNGGDGGPATDAQMQSPWGFAYHGSTLYISDSGASIVRSVTAGTINNFVGNYTSGGWAHVWGQAPTDAWLAQPYGLAWDSSNDDLYITDQGTNQLYKAAGGLMNVVAGDAVSGPEGVTGQQEALRFDVPAGVAVDGSGNAYVADEGDNKIFILSFGSTPGNFAGTGDAEFLDKSPRTAARLSDLGSMARAPDGTFVVADPNNRRIRIVDQANNRVTSIGTGAMPTWAGDGGPNSGATFHDTTAVERDAAGDLYVVEQGENRVRVLHANGTVATLAGNGLAGFSGDGGPATQAQLDEPDGVAVDASGNVYISDYNNGRIRKVDAAGNISTIAGSGNVACGNGPCGDGGDATDASLDRPAGLVIDSDGNLLIADQYNHRVRKIDFNTGFMSTIAGTGDFGSSGDGGAAIDAELRWPISLAWDPTDSALFISDLVNETVRKVEGGNISTFAGTGTPGDSGDGGDATAATLQSITGLAWNTANGSLYIGDLFDHRIREVRQDGKIYAFSGDDGVQGYAGDGGPYRDPSVRYYGPNGFVINTWGTSDGTLASLFVADGTHLREIDLDQNIIRTVGDGTGTTAGYGGDNQLSDHVAFDQPSFVAVDSNSNIVVADTGDQRVRKIYANGVVATLAGANGEFKALAGIAVDDNGNTYVSDTQLNEVFEIDMGGNVTVFAGTGVEGISGDGGPAVDAQLTDPAALAWHDGNLYIADSGYVRMVDGDGNISTVAGTGASVYSGDGGLATSAGIGVINTIGFDSNGNMFLGAVTFEPNIRIRRIDHLTGDISTVALSTTGMYYGDKGGAMNAGLWMTRGIVFDNSDNLYFAEGAPGFFGVGGGQIRKIVGPL
jgi:sugar lactone lactonase YvrE